MDAPQTPATMEKNARARQLQDDEENNKTPPLKKTKPKRTKFKPKVIREGKPVRKPKSNPIREGSPVRKPKANPVREGKPAGKPTVAKPVRKRKAKPIKKSRWLPVRKQKTMKPTEKVEGISNKRKAQCEPVRRNLNFDDKQEGLDLNEKPCMLSRVDENINQDVLDLDENSSLQSSGVNEIIIDKIVPSVKKKRTVTAKKECTSDWEAINQHSVIMVPFLTKKRKMITKDECRKGWLGLVVDDAGNIKPSIKKRRKMISKAKSKNCWKNVHIFPSGEFTFEKQKESMPVLNKVEKKTNNIYIVYTRRKFSKHKKPAELKKTNNIFIVYTRRKFFKHKKPDELSNVNCVQPATHQKVSFCKISHQDIISELNDSDYGHHGNTIQARCLTSYNLTLSSRNQSDCTQPSTHDSQVSECMWVLNEDETTSNKLGETQNIQESEIHESEASYLKADNASKIDLCHQPSTPEKPMGRSIYQRNLSSYGPEARIELLIAKQMKLKGKRCRLKKRVSRVDLTALCFNQMVNASVASKTSPKININNTYKGKRVTRKDINNIIRKLQFLKLDCHHDKALVPYSGADRMLVPLVVKKRRLQAKVDLDPESNRMWELLMGTGIDCGSPDMDKENEKYWEEERRVFYGRVDSFIVNMELILGDREFSPWKGSVVDSVVGVYLTQNVSDHLSSSAFMSLAARFPLRSKCSNGTANVEQSGLKSADDIIKLKELLPDQQLCDRSSLSGITPMSQNANNPDTSMEIEVCSEKHSCCQGGTCLCSHVENVNTAVFEQQETISAFQINGAVEQNETILNSQDLGDGILNSDEACNSRHDPTEIVNDASKDKNDREESKKMTYDWNNLRKTIENTTTFEEREAVVELHVDILVEQRESLAEQSETCLNTLDSDRNNNLHSGEACRSQKDSSENLNEVSRDIKEANDWNNLSMQTLENATLFEHRETIAELQAGCVVEQSEICLNSQNLDRNNNLNSGEACSYKKNSAQNSKDASKDSKEEKEEKEEIKEVAYDWDSLRKQTFENGVRKERSNDALDSLDYEAVRCADNIDIADAIKERGQHNNLAKKIKAFLNRTVKIHGSIDLEWLRDVPPEKTKEYLLNIDGLGIKSVECVRLLTLHHQAFPVDTNVGRICVRLGWVPLQPLPESVQLHLLELYPVQETIQKYLWPRLCKLDHKTLYKLHYLLIAAGKVFCTKIKPNCNACPMRGECRHFASAFASSRLALPGPQDTSLVGPAASFASHNYWVSDPMLPPQLDESILSQSRLVAQDCEPIIEEPASPEPVQLENLEMDIEDYFVDDPDGIPTIKLNLKEFTYNVKNCMQEMNIDFEGDMSKALVHLTPEAASIPMPKLKNVNRLRTEHYVYELEDSSPLLEGFEKRDPGDPCPYLLAIWSPGETAQSTETPEVLCDSQHGFMCDMTTCSKCNGMREAKAGTVRGTILIPCRTANRGSFPLNGTYFQVNEVFADHYTSHTPLNVPRQWILHPRRLPVYFGTSVTSMLKGLTTTQVQTCFWKGFVCVRAYDRETRTPKPLCPRLHLSAAMAAKINQQKGRKSTKINGKTKNIP